MLLILLWAIIISFVIIMYVLLDGFDLGIGILFPFIKNAEQRDVAFSTITPVWDGNETWLVMGGASLYAAFPVAYSTLLPTLYMPLMIMLAALIFRGIAFEFRFKAQRNRFMWDISFAAGSMVAAFTQGLILGTFVKGYGNSLPITVSSFEWFTPFSVMTGIAVVFGYALLGSNWLIAKTVGELQEKMYHAAKILLMLVVIFLLIVSVWTPLADPRIMTRWFTVPNIYYLAPLPILTGVATLYNFYTLHKRYEFLPFCLSIVLFIFAYVGFCISDWPYIIPHAVTIWQAASAPSALKFTLVGVAILLPILLIYTAYSYRVFRGKVTVAEHY
jgi:cytochrome bd ubiquinol oxidase subunit II